MMEIILIDSMRGRHLQVFVLAITALYLCFLPRQVEATYQNDVKIAAELWVDITYQDYLYLNGTISKEEWTKANYDFHKNFYGIKGSQPKRFEKDFSTAVATILNIENKSKSALMAIIASPKNICIDEYRKDIWRASRIQTKMNNNVVPLQSIKGQRQKDNLSKEREDLSNLVNEKYGHNKNSNPIFTMFNRSYYTVFAQDVVWADIIPTASRGHLEVLLLAEKEQCQTDHNLGNDRQIKSP